MSENRVEKSCSILPPAVYKIKLFPCSEVALVCLLIIGMGSLVSLPIIVYNLPKSEVSNTSGSGNDYGGAVYSSPLHYATNSGICLTELDYILRSTNGPTDPEGYLLVMRNDEITARELIYGLITLGASAECLRKAVPFLCLHLFGLCSGAGLSIQPTSSQCEEIRDTTCKQQWMVIETLDIGLPDCEIFPAESLSCPALNSSLSNNGTSTMLEKYSNETTEVPECHGDFYHENGSSYCIRSCYTWVQLFQNERWKISDPIAVILLSCSILASAVVIIISCLEHKRMLNFPAVFIVYIMIDHLILYILTMASFMNRRKLFCTSRSLIKSLTEVSLYCVISGILSVYVLGQGHIWWLFHTANLFWKVIFPLHALSFETSGKNKYIHITCIIVGILLPLFPITVIMADSAVDFQGKNPNSTSLFGNSFLLSGGLGFGYTRFPPVVCTSKNTETFFYSFILMLDLIMGCGCTLLIVVFWAVHKFYIKRKRVQKNVNLNTRGKLGPHFTFGRAEKKLLIVLCYYVLLGGIVLTAHALDSRTSSDYIKNFQRFLFCQQGKQSSNNSCIHSGNDSIGFDFFLIFSNMLVTFVPFVNLLYAVNIQELKKLWKDYPRIKFYKFL